MALAAPAAAIASDAPLCNKPGRKFGAGNLMRFRSCACAVLALLSACAEKGSGPVIATGDRYMASKSLPTEYRLGTGDHVKVTVFTEPTLGGDFSVGANGMVSLPLIGDVPARGKTVDMVAADAQARFADGFLRNPRVSMEVSTYRPFYILGEVVQPGTYPFAVGLTALGAVATAKGFTPRANREVVEIRREGDPAEETFRLTPDLHVYPGDTIRVGERYF